ncbi:MAG: hypothetical protein ACFCUJ_01080 [Thiotrichales bacterium]
MADQFALAKLKAGGRAWIVLACSMWAMAGCSGSEDTTATAAQLRIGTPASIAQASDYDYNNNVNGIITGATLKRWKDDWLGQRPAGVTGKLVVLQVTKGPEAAEYIKPNNRNVFTYLVPTADWIQTRSNGVILTESMVPDGPTMDALLKKHNIDPTQDMVVCALGTGSTGNAMAQGRCWYALRYWGMPAKQLAILNGSNDWQVTSGVMAATDFAAATSSPPNTGTVSVRDLTEENTALQATLQDLMAVLPASNNNAPNDGVFIWDARSIDQFSAGEIDEAGNMPAKFTCASGDYMCSFQNNGSRQGHPTGSLQLNFTNMLLATEGFRYKNKADIEHYFNGGADAAGRGFVDGTYAKVGAGNAVQPNDIVYSFCETTFRAMITGVASAVIMGKPTRFYDGAMVEWNSLSHLMDASGNFILPADSPWRTDVRSYFRPAANPSLVAQRIINDPYATHTNAIVLADRAYKAGTSVSGSGGGGAGAVLPPNPCGG